MRKIAALIVAGLLCPLTTRATDIWLAGDPVVQKQAGHSYDYMDMFEPGSPWERASSSVKVFKTSTQWIMTASDSNLTRMFADLRRRGIVLGVEALMIPQASPQSCGEGIEGYSLPGTMTSMALRIKKLGGSLHYIAMDEPLWFGHQYQGQHACRTPISSLATSLAINVSAIRAVFPDIVIGDIEPLSLTRVPDWLDKLASFAAAYRGATGGDLAFVHADVQWSENTSSELQQFVARMRTINLKAGIIYNGAPDDPSDVAWTEHAEQHFISAESLVVPDHAIFQTWMLHPSHMLPETQAGTMTYLVNRYTASRTNLALRLSGSKVIGQLNTSRQSPIAGARIIVRGLDTTIGGRPSTVTMTGTVPSTAFSAIWAMRINTECDGCSGPVNINVGVMKYTDSGTSISRAFPHTQYVGDAGKTYAPNSAPFQVTAGRPFTLTVPMAIPYESRNSGYIEIIWRNQAGTPFVTHQMPFSAATVLIGEIETDANGQFILDAPLPGMLTAEYKGDVTHLSSSATISTLMQSISR